MAHGAGSTTALVLLSVKPCCSPAPKTLQSTSLHGTAPAVPACLPARVPVQPPWGAPFPLQSQGCTAGRSWATKAMTQLPKYSLILFLLWVIRLSCQHRGKVLLMPTRLRSLMA